MIGVEINERYQLEAELGRGGMGVVYRGRDLLLKRPVAVKIVGPAALGTEGRARLLQEAQAAASLNQPSIVAVYDAGEAELPGFDDPAAFVVMELVEGQTLREFTPADVAESATILEQICDALDSAHRRGIIHRDLKPENVIRSRTGQIKLMDFGLAWFRDRPRLTQDGTLMGTLDYLAPEIIQGRPASAQSDLYALGVMAYELLTGRPPFRGETPAAVLAQHLHAPPTPPSVQNEMVPPGLDHLVILLLNKEPENRPSSAEAVRQSLLDIASAPAHPGSLPAKAGIPGPRLDFLARGRMVGREREVAEGMALWRRAAGGERQVLLISGEPGIGKTRLASEIAARVQFGGARLLEGRCYATGGLPYMPISQMIRSAFAGRNPPTLPPAVLKDILQLAPDINSQPHKDTTAESSTPAEEEGRLYESIAVLCQVMIREGPLLIFIDDLQWADSGTVAAIRHLARRLPAAPVMILATYREIELTGRRPIRDLLDDLRREAGAVRLKLGRLDRQQTEALLATLFDEAITPEFLDAIYRETEGNPFFVEEICKALVESGELTFEAGQWQRSSTGQLWLPQSIQVTIESRLEQIDEGSLEVLRVAAILGREFRFDTLQVATALEEVELVEALEGAIRAQLVQETAADRTQAAKEPWFAFTHALIQATLLDGLGTLRRQLMSRRLARALEEAYPDEPATMIPLLGRLFSEAGDGQKAVPYLLQAGNQARGLFAYDEAIASYEEALLFLREGDELDLTARTLMALGATYLKAAQYERSRLVYDEAFGLLRRAPRVRATAGKGLINAPHPFRTHTGEPLTLDPTRAGETSSTYVTRQMFEGLVELGPADEVLPAAAESWQIQDGGRRYIFHLRADRTWSDGTPVTAADFEFAWKRSLDPRQGQRLAPAFFDIQGAGNYFEGLTTDASEIGVKALSPTTLQIELEKPVAYFLHLAAAEFAFPAPQHVVERYGDQWAEIGKIVTNGAFIPAHWERGQRLVLTRNPAYNGPFGGNLKQVEFYLVNDAKLLDKYAAGELDCLYPSLLSAADMAQALRRFGAELVSLPSMATSYLAFNCGRPPLDDKRVRRAIALAIDRQELSDRVLLGLHGPANSGFISPGIAGHGLGRSPTFDPEAARRLLVEAGYPGGQGLPRIVACETATPGDLSSPGVWICDRLGEEIGLELELRQISMSDMVKYMDSDERQLWYLGWSADYSDPDGFMRVGNLPELCNWQNEGFVRLVEDARLERDQARRLELYRQAEMILAQEAPLVPMIYGRWHMLVKPWVKRLATSPTVWTVFKDVVLDDAHKRQI